MKIKLLILLLPCFLFSKQLSNWKQFVYRGNIETFEIIDTNKYLMGSRSGGLIEYDKSTEKFTYYTQVNSKLPSNWISSIVRDFSNTIWIGTSAGLVKYENGVFDVLTPENSQIATLSVTTLGVGKNNELWIGSVKGVQKYANNTFSDLHELLNKEAVTKIVVDTASNVWIAPTNVEDGFFTLFNDTSLVCMDNHRPSQHVVDKNNVAWYYTRDGLFSIDNYKILDKIKYDESNSPLEESDGVKSIMVGPDNLKYFGVVDKGFYIYNSELSQWNVLDTSNSPLKDYDDRLIYIDSSNKLYFSGLDDYKQSHIYSISNNEAHTLLYPNKDGLFPDDISSLFVDKNDNVWCGLYSGITMLDQNNPNVIDSAGFPIDNKRIHSALLDQDDIFWFSTNSGLVKFDGENRWVYPIDGENGPKDGGKIAKDSSGNIWVGTFYGKLSYFDGTTWNKIDSIFSGTSILSVNITSDNKVVVATYSDGIIHNKNGIWEIEDSSNSNLISNDIYGFSLDKYDNEYIIYDRIGLSIRKADTLLFFDSTNSGLPCNNIKKIYHDNDTMWIVTYWPSAVTKFDGTTWTTFDYINSGLNYGSINAITFDSKGNKWISTDNGLSVYNENEVGIIKGVNKSTKNDIVKNFNISDKFLYFNTDNVMKSILIYNMRGQAVYKVNNTLSANKIDISLFSKGFYILDVNVKNKKYNKKFVLCK